MCVETDEVNLCGDQITYEEAMNGPEAGEWRKAMEEELTVSMKMMCGKLWTDQSKLQW